MGAFCVSSISVHSSHASKQQSRPNVEGATCTDRGGSRTEGGREKAAVSAYAAPARAQYTCDASSHKRWSSVARRECATRADAWARMASRWAVGPVHGHHAELASVAVMGASE